MMQYTLKKKKWIFKDKFNEALVVKQKLAEIELMCLLRGLG